MKTFNVNKTSRDKSGHPIETKKVGEVTAYTFTDAMRKAANEYNNGNWANISVEIKTKTPAD